VRPGEPDPAASRGIDRSGELEPLTAPEPPDLPEAETAEERMARRRSWLGRLLAPVAVLVGVLVKFGAFAIKFFGIFLAVGGYALIWGLPFAVGFVLLILAHELGHYVEAKRLGLDPQLPVFIPFLGAYVALRNARFDPWRNARVSIAGPIAGGAAAFGVYVAGHAGDSRLLLALAYTGFMLNLINLLPVWILDGAQVLQSWRVLRRGAGAPSPDEAHRLSWIVAVVTGLTVVALVAGMVLAHVPQDRL
jgi:Zn-dependent protease